MNIKTLKTSWWVPTSYVIINSSRVQCLKKNEQNITTRKRIHTCLKRLTLQYPRYKLQANKHHLIRTAHNFRQEAFTESTECLSPRRLRLLSSLFLDHQLLHEWFQFDQLLQKNFTNTNICYGPKKQKIPASFRIIESLQK